MAATEGMAALQRQFGATLGEPLCRMDEAIATLDFEGALQLCKAMIDELIEGQPE